MPVQVVDLKGHFKLLQKLGDGSTGMVYKVVERQSNQMFALKLIPLKSRADVLRSIKSFSLQQKLLGHCQEFACVRAMFVGRWRGVSYLCILSDLINGENLFDLLQKNHSFQLSPEQLDFLYQEINLLHSLGVLHGDVAWRNVMIQNKDPLPRLIDFDNAEPIRRSEAARKMYDDDWNNLQYFPAEEQQVFYESPEFKQDEAVNASLRAQYFGAKE